jgi:acetolactate synthase-1/2/3 large subunit
MIYQAKHPLILIASGANRKHISQPLEDFIAKSDIPFFMTQMGKGVVNESHPHCLGTASLSANDFIHCAIDKADLIINVGHDDVEKPPFIMEKGGKKVIHMNYYSSDVDDTYFPQLDVLGDIGSNLSAMSEALVKQDHWDFEYFLEAKQDADKHITKYFNDSRFPILPQRAVKLVRDAMDKKDIVTLDNGVYKIWFSRNYQCYAPNTLLLDNALATMGAGLSSAMAAKMVHPDRKVISVSGDGGFMMNSQELETAVRLNLDLVAIVLNDGSYGMIKWKQAGMGFDDFGLDYNNPDFVKYAESFGAKGHRPTSCEDFEEILNRVLNEKGVHLIDLAIDYSLNHSILNELLKHKTCS